MKTNFEDYLKKNRASLDIEDPDDDFIWSGIQNDLRAKKSFNFFSWKMAAIVLIALMSGFMLNSIINQNSKVVLLSLADISPEYAQQERFYQAAIQQKWDQINEEKIERSDYRDLFKEMDLLEKMKVETLKDLEELGGNPRLVKTLFEYYEIKVRLLEIMLAEIDKKKNDEIKNQNNEKYI